MRLIVVSNLYPPHFLGGYELLCEQVVESLVRRGHTVDVLTSIHGASGVERRGTVEVHRILDLHQPFGRAPVLSRTRELAVTHGNQAIVARFIAERSPDVVFMWSQLRLCSGPVRAAQSSAATVVFTFNDDHIVGYLPRRPAWSIRALLRACADRTIHRRCTSWGMRLEHVTCISRCLRDDIVAKGVAIADARVIYQGIPIERFPCKADAGALGDPVRLLYVGQLHPYKGVHTAIEALAVVAREGGPRLRLSIAGDGPDDYKRRLSDLAQGLDVTFLGRCAPEELPALYRAHDVFIFPSIWREPFGLTFLEAMASGCTLVATADGGQAECIEDGRDALVFPAGDAVALASRLRRLCDDRALSRRLAAAARAKVESSFTLERYVDECERFLVTARADDQLRRSRTDCAGAR
ncbi:MAG TPA: glycosyltransferase family 4 protein [Planctomycetota bacterium]|nr:glycosyltransferase family 4 protein [Planctomycetota bacterium]